MFRRAWVCVVGCIALAHGTASAGLGEDADRLCELWSRHYTVTRLKPRLLERGQLLPILVPAEAANGAVGGCTTVVVMTTISTQHILRLMPPRAGWPDPGWLLPSVAGVTQITRCGTRKALLPRLAVEMRSPRAVIQTIIARSRVPLPSVHRYLSHRNPGPGASSPDPGPPPVPGDLDARIRGAQSRNHSRGATTQSVRTATSNREGAGRLTLRIDPGCYRFDVLGEQPPKVSGSDPDAPSQKRRVDIDVDLTWVQGQGPPVSDHSQAPDASIEFCTIERTAGRVRYSGALPFGQVVFVQATWPLPDGWPLRWPPVAATRAAKLLWDRRTLSFGTLVFEAKGTTGVTLVPVEFEPDGCYLAAVATARGQIGAMLLEASASGAAHRSRSGKTGAVVAFCAQGADAGLLQVTARGTAVDYNLGLWQTGRIKLGVSAP